MINIKLYRPRNIPHYFLCGVIFLGIPELNADNVLRKEPIHPIREVSGLNPDKVALGAKLFNDSNLSADGSVSCATCHPLDRYGVDGLNVSTGVNGKQGTRNAPTVFNSVINFRQFWDGRAKTLEEQAAGPLTNPVEMAMNWPDILRYLAKDSTYRALFDQAYERVISQETVTNAIAEFERSLSTPDSKFDFYLKGDDNAITEQEKRGYQYFKNYGCISCHQGAGVGGNLYEKFGVFEEYFNKERPVTDSDLGRYAITHIEEDRYEFKVPSLRNVAETAPYFHNGSVAKLEEAISIMAKYQLGIELPEQHRDDISAFLKSLTGHYHEK